MALTLFTFRRRTSRHCCGRPPPTSPSLPTTTTTTRAATTMNRATPSPSTTASSTAHRSRRTSVPPSSRHRLVASKLTSSPSRRITRAQLQRRLEVSCRHACPPLAAAAELISARPSVVPASPFPSNSRHRLPHRQHPVPSARQKATSNRAQASGHERAACRKAVARRRHHRRIGLKLARPHSDAPTLRPRTENSAKRSPRLAMLRKPRTSQYVDQGDSPFLSSAGSTSRACTSGTMRRPSISSAQVNYEPWRTSVRTPHHIAHY